jgi:hypothetical protein
VSITVSDANGYSLGSIDGDAIYNANGQKAGAVVNGNKIWDANQHEVGAVVNGNEIWDANQHKSVLWSMVMKSGTRTSINWE